jgi:hypothetical protein
MPRPMQRRRKVNVPSQPREGRLSCSHGAQARGNGANRPPRLNFLFPLSPIGATETPFNRPDGAQTTEEDGRIASPFVPRACAAWLLTVALAGLTRPGRVPGSWPARIPTPVVRFPGSPAAPSRGMPRAWIPPLRPGVYPPAFRWRVPSSLKPLHPSVPMSLRPCVPQPLLSIKVTRANGLVASGRGGPNVLCIL